MIQEIKFIKVSGVEIRNAYKQRIEELSVLGAKELTNGNLHNVVRARLLQKYNGNENDIIENQVNGCHYWCYSKATNAVDFRSKHSQFFK